jgi:hypothetical protein
LNGTHVLDSLSIEIVEAAVSVETVLEELLAGIYLVQDGVSVALLVGRVDAYLSQL